MRAQDSTFRRRHMECQQTNIIIINRLTCLGITQACAASAYNYSLLVHPPQLSFRAIAPYNNNDNIDINNNDM